MAYSQQLPGFFAGSAARRVMAHGWAVRGVQSIHRRVIFLGAYLWDGSYSKHLSARLSRAGRSLGFAGITVLGARAEATSSTAPFLSQTDDPTANGAQATSVPQAGSRAQAAARWPAGGGKVRTSMADAMDAVAEAAQRAVRMLSGQKSPEERAEMQAHRAAYEHQRVSFSFTTRSRRSSVASTLTRSASASSASSTGFGIEDWPNLDIKAGLGQHHIPLPAMSTAAGRQASTGSAVSPEESPYIEDPGSPFTWSAVASPAIVAQRSELAANTGGGSVSRITPRMTLASPFNIAQKSCLHVAASVASSAGSSSEPPAGSNAHHREGPAEVCDVRVELDYPSLPGALTGVGQELWKIFLQPPDGAQLAAGQVNLSQGQAVLPRTLIPYPLPGDRGARYRAMAVERMQAVAAAVAAVPAATVTPSRSSSGPVSEASLPPAAAVSRGNAAAGVTAVGKLLWPAGAGCLLTVLQMGVAASVLGLNERKDWSTMHMFVDTPHRLGLIGSKWLSTCAKIAETVF